MWEKKVNLTESIVQEKGRSLQVMANSSTPQHKHINMQFSNGRIYAFKKRSKFKFFKSYGESGDADREAAGATPGLRALVGLFGPNKVFNADEFGLFYSLAPSSTIGPYRLPGRKKRKERASFLVCCNSTRTEKLPALVIGRSQWPRYFRGSTPSALGIHYSWSKKAWSNMSIFYEWLQTFDQYLSKWTERKIILLTDNASAHSADGNLPVLQNILVKFLPKCETSILQLVERAIDLAEEDFSRNL